MPEPPLILCVDDNEGARYALTRTLERAGFRISEAASGREALAKARQGPDLIVLDVQLPDLNGYEVCQRIKADPATASIPVLQISADFVDVEHRTRGLELGADAYLAHPIEPPELIATIRSLLRARRAEEQARAAARQLQSTFDSISEGICLLDGEGKVVRCNQAMVRLTGIDEPQIVGKRCDGLLPDAGAGAAADPFRRMAKSLAREEETVRFGDSWLRVSCDPVLDDRGALSGAVLIYSDLTERRRAQEERERLLSREQSAQGQARAALDALQASERQLREKVSELETADHRKDEFLAMLAHELRNPLAAITTGVHVLEQVGEPGGKPERIRATLLRQIGVLTRLVDDLLDVSRITRGKVELRREPTLVQDAVTHAVATSRPLVEERRHTLLLDVPREPIAVDADPTRLEQVIWNLINNAAKYTEPAGEILVSLREERGEAVLRVRDNGIGIEPAMLDHVFELFTQADQSPARSRGGLGVGLTLVRRLVEMHGGSVRAHSEGLGKGSEFEVRLPLSAGAPAAARAQLGKTAGKRRLLLIEDNPDIGETLRDLLQLLGHRVELATDGLRGVQLALATRPEAALVDIGLPGIDGYEVARRLRASEIGREIALVALTGYGRPEDRDRALEAGFDAHLVKPVEPDELSRLLGELTARRDVSHAG